MRPKCIYRRRRRSDTLGLNILYLLASQQAVQSSFLLADFGTICGSPLRPSCSSSRSADYMLFILLGHGLRNVP
ncbi:hypothetical protein BDZ89DRAFT_1076351 [Hymenopellis radicata]|nr:hypothetical protein BDZ89DRAFT_1076351 [Hymenopellis radicata]